MALILYQTNVQRLLGTGSAGNLYSTSDLTAYINTARKQIAAEGQCIRALPPISGPITAVTLNSGGSNYAAATQILISAPDSPPGSGSFPAGQHAAATLTLASGVITAVTLNSAGIGYFTAGVSYSGAGSGAGATIIATVSGINQTVINTEVYPFSAVNPYVATSGSGIASILMVQSVAVIWGTYRYLLSQRSFSAYQAYVRTYGRNYQDVPAVYTQYGQGDQGSIYLYPIPNAAYQLEWDCVCLPISLANDADPEAIPYPWTDAVPFLAAYYAFSGSQRFADADRMWKEYERFVKRARQMSASHGTANWYGR